jgi:CubicO group peptidase (beta-lactamase class C family)
VKAQLAAMWLAASAASGKGGGPTASPARRWSGKPRSIALFAVSLLCAPLTQADDFEGVFHRAKLSEVDAAIEKAIAERKCPGGVIWIEHRGVAYHRAYGSRAIEPQREPTSEDTIFDAASLTKVTATTPAMLLLIERGAIELDAPVSRYWPDFAAHGKEAITIRHLLTHSSGLRPGVGPGAQGRDAVLAQVCGETPTTTPGTKFRYSDINFITLGEVVQRAAGRPLEEFCGTEIFAPLAMRDTMYRPAAEVLRRVAPTERGTPRGTVHDPTSRRMGGVAGHAGLFTTASDLARYARMLLHEGELDGVRLFKPETVRLMIGTQSPDAVWETRGLGWDIDSPYAGPRGGRFPLVSYGHTGWTGGSLWIDPWSQTFVVFLSNRNHPTEAGNVLPLRRLLGTLAAEALVDAPE